MPPFTVVNPTDAVVTGPGGPYPAFSAKQVTINNQQAANLVQNRDCLLIRSSATEREVARAAFALLSTLTPGYSTPLQREQMRLRAGLQEWQDLLRLLRSVD